MPDTIPKFLTENARTRPDDDAMREKEFGIWQTYSWHDYAEEVRRLACGLAELGFKRGDKVAIIGDNRPKLYFAMLAAQSLGGISVALYQDSIAKELSYVIHHSEARFVIAEDEEQVDKLYEIKDQIPHVERVVYYFTRGLELNEDPWLIHLAEMQKLGDAFAEKQPDYFANELAQGQSDDVCMYSYTSGTTGMPKGVMLTHGNILMVVHGTIELESMTADDVVMAYLPMAWIGDYFLSVGTAVVAGMAVCCPESPETLSRDFRESGPTVTVAPPAVWEGLLTRIQVRMEDADWLKRGLFNAAMNLALKVERMQQAGTPVPAGQRFLNWLGEYLVRQPLRDLIGNVKVRIAYTGGAPLGPDTFDYIRALGVNLKQLYGLTESSSACVYQPDGEANSETVGRPLPDVDVKIGENGEIYLRGKHVFVGYYKNEEATRETLDAEGWLASGDAGFMDESGHLKVIDRAKDVSKLADGTLFAPQFIENKLKFSLYIKEAVVFGKDLDYVTAMINIELDALENWAERAGISYGGYRDLSQKPEVYELIRAEIGRINETLGHDEALRGARIRRFLILSKELDADDGEITRTRKIRRSVIAERYGDLFDALYGGADEVHSEVTVTYEDGSTGVIKSDLRILGVDDGVEAKAA
jgi:long-chain acyl-CoA synthetase